MTDNRPSTQSGMSRRRFLSLTGGGFVVAAGGGIAGFSLTRTPHHALSPWHAAGSYNEPRRFALSYAILVSPNISSPAFRAGLTRGCKARLAGNIGYIGKRCNAAAASQAGSRRACQTRLLAALHLL